MGRTEGPTLHPKENPYSATRDGRYPFKFPPGDAGGIGRQRTFFCKRKTVQAIHDNCCHPNQAVNVLSYNKGAGFDWSKKLDSSKQKWELTEQNLLKAGGVPEEAVDMAWTYW